MAAFNVVRFNVKPGMEKSFLDAHKNISETWSGMRHANMINSGEGATASSQNGRAWKRYPPVGR